MKKVVLYPIEVPSGKYCWEGHVCCEFFDNEGGHPHCALHFYEQKEDHKTGWVLKPKKCLKLKSQ